MPWPDRFQEIVRVVKGRSSGQLYELYAMIHQLLDAKEAGAVCTYFGVSERMTAREEEDLLSKWLGHRGKWTKKVKNFLLCEEEKKEELVPGRLRIALMMIGWWYSEKAGRAHTASMAHPAEVRPKAAPPLANPLVPAALALVIRSSKVGDLPTVFEPPLQQRVIDLIAGAVYFRCAHPTVIDAKEKELGLAGETAQPTPQREHDVYLRLDIKDGGDLLDAENRFALKNRLRDGPPRTIRLVHQVPLDCPAGSWHDFHSI